MKRHLIEVERQDIDDHIRTFGLDPEAFAYREQASECITIYVRKPSRVFGTRIPAEAIALYPKSRPDLYITFERDPGNGFRSSFRPAPPRNRSVSVMTWAALMVIFDQWLERLAECTTGTRSVQPVATASCSWAEPHQQQ